MTTSGVNTLALTARDIITFALNKISTSPVGQSPSEDEIAPVILELNMMMKEWEFDGPNLWRQTLGSTALQAGVGCYGLTVENPLRLTECRYRYPSTGNVSEERDLPMEEMTRSAFMELPMKLAPGPVPTMWYFDPQAANQYPSPSPTSQYLYIWPVPPNPTTDKLVYTYQRRFQIIQNLNDIVDVPQEWLSTVGYNLAARMVDDYGVEGASSQRIVTRAAVLYSKAKAFDRESTVRFMPNYRFRRG
jgi:hypothetical protein